MTTFRHILRRGAAPILVAVLVILIPSITFAEDNFLESGLKSVLWTIVNVVFGWMVWASGLLLNLAITKYVVGFGAVFESSGLGYSVNTLWATVRDIFNLTFIFGLVYIGFKMIFNSGDSNAKRMLGSLILAALLVNFSLFITKFIIDFSNIAAAQFAQAFNAGGAGTYAVSDGFMKLFGLSGIWNTGSSLPALEGGASYAYIFGTLFLYLIASFVFTAGGLLLIIRFVVLNIYMILSPLMFLGLVFPGLQSISSSYWNGFLGRAFFAPAYILMLYFAHQVLVNMQGVVTAGSRGLAGSFATTGKASDAAASFEATFVFFIITAVFLISALVVAQKMGAVGASNAVAIGKRFSSTARKYTQQKAGSATFGAAAVVGQRTVGYGANRLAERKGFQDWAAKSKAGQAMLGATRKVADTSFDARQVAGVGTALGVGAGKKGGYDTRIKEQSDADAKFAKSLKTNKVKRGLDGKIINDSDGAIQETIDKDVEEQKGKIDTEYGYSHAKHKLAIDAEKAAKAALLAEDQKQSTIATEISQIEAEVAKLEQEKTGLISNQRRLKEEEIAAKKQELAVKQQAAGGTNKKALEEAAKKAQLAREKAEKAELAALKAATESAESKIEYANQLAFIARKQQQANSIITGGASSVTAMAAGVAGFGGFGLVAGIPISRSFRRQNQESVDNLKKIYGDDGRTQTKSKKERDNMRILAEIQKESGESPTATT